MVAMLPQRMPAFEADERSMPREEANPRCTSAQDSPESLRPSAIPAPVRMIGSRWERFMVWSESGFTGASPFENPGRQVALAFHLTEIAALEEVVGLQ